MTNFQLPTKIVHSPKLKLNIVLNVHNNHNGKELTSGGEVTPTQKHRRTQHPHWASAVVVTIGGGVEARNQQNKSKITCVAS